MANDIIISSLIIITTISFSRCSSSASHDINEFMSREERNALKEEARDMFYHAYNAYMDNAYPADELMPLSCKGRYRGSEADRGDIDSVLGNFSLTLVDTLDTLVVLSDLSEFENAVKLVVRDVSFDTDVIVSLFETNIRMLGGLLSGHILSEYLQLRADIMPWYRGELLNLAKDLGYRFLPAFNTSTGIPYGRINLKYGMKGVPTEMCRETCTACAGSMILEMAALSRLTGESIFEEKAQKAMDALWKMRHRGTDLMGSVLNVHSGDWVRRDSGVGAGIDSYYEYCLKAYILLGDEKYLGRFNKHYQAVMKYVSQGPMLLDVHMHRPNTNSKNFMDALLAFWPGLQVLKGDIKPAVETHEMLYQVMQRHNFIPEAFTTDFQVHWGHHPLRPEFLESTYFLYRATGDHYYLGVGKKVLKSLQTYARVTCGYAAVSDVRTNKHDDTMDSFVLSETFKYLFLLFAEPTDLVLDLDEFIFTTEGHLLPLTLAAMRTNASLQVDIDAFEVDELDRTCPNSLHLFPASVRQPLRNMVEDVCPRRSIKRKLSAAQFQANNLEHLKLLSNMGIVVLTMADGRMQLLHTFSNAKSMEDAQEGLMFMQDMVELNRKQSLETEKRRLAISFANANADPVKEVTLIGGPAEFGLQLKGLFKIIGKPVITEPVEACTELTNADQINGNIAVMYRGDCMFVDKARKVQRAGGIGGIVLDTIVGSSIATSPMFAMAGDGVNVNDIKIPMAFLFNVESNELLKAMSASDGVMFLTIGEYAGEETKANESGEYSSMFERLKTSVKEFLLRPATPESKSTNPNPPLIHQQQSSQFEQKQTDEDGFIIIDHGNLRAVIPKTEALKTKKLRSSTLTVKLSTNKLNIPKTRTPFPTTDFSVLPAELFWRSFIQFLVNMIHISPSHKIPIDRIEQYHYWLQKERVTGKSSIAAENLTIIELISWFLNELINVRPADNNNEALRQTYCKALKQQVETLTNAQLLKNGFESDEIAAIERQNIYRNFLSDIQQVCNDNEDDQMHKKFKLGRYSEENREQETLDVARAIMGDKNFEKAWVRAKAVETARQEMVEEKVIIEDVMKEFKDFEDVTNNVEELLKAVKDFRDSESRGKSEDESGMRIIYVNSGNEDKNQGIGRRNRKDNDKNTEEIKKSEKVISKNPPKLERNPEKSKEENALDAVRAILGDDHFQEALARAKLIETARQKAIEDNVNIEETVKIFKDYEKVSKDIEEISEAVKDFFVSDNHRKPEDESKKKIIYVDYGNKDNNIDADRRNRKEADENREKIEKSVAENTRYGEQNDGGSDRRKKDDSLGSKTDIFLDTVKSFMSEEEFEEALARTKVVETAVREFEEHQKRIQDKNKTIKDDEKILEEGKKMSEAVKDFTISDSRRAPKDKNEMRTHFVENGDKNKEMDRKNSKYGEKNMRKVGRIEENGAKSGPHGGHQQVTKENSMDNNKEAKGDIDISDPKVQQKRPNEIRKENNNLGDESDEKFKENSGDDAKAEVSVDARVLRHNSLDVLDVDYVVDSESSEKIVDGVILIDEKMEDSLKMRRKRKYMVVDEL